MKERETPMTTDEKDEVESRQVVSSDESESNNNAEPSRDKRLCIRLGIIRTRHHCRATRESRGRAGFNYYFQQPNDI